MFRVLSAGAAFWGLYSVSPQVGRGLRHLDLYDLGAERLAAGARLLLGLLAAKRYRLARGEALDLTPSLHWPQPTVLIEPAAGHGPVMVAVEYHVDPAQAADFARTMREVRLERLRDGAMRWELFQAPADPPRYVEAFLVESWVEHLRRHERVTLAGRGAAARALALHIGPAPPTVLHLIAVRAAETTTARVSQ